MSPEETGPYIFLDNEPLDIASIVAIAGLTPKGEAADTSPQHSHPTVISGWAASMLARAGIIY